MYSEPEWSRATTKSGSLEVMKEGKIIGTVPIPFGTKFFTFGRLPENNLPLDHESISRKHAVLQFGPRDTAFIYDLGSSHGTFVNKKRIPENQYVKITSGNAIIKFGASSRQYILNLEENMNEVVTTRLPQSNQEFRAVVSSFFSEHGISSKDIEFMGVGSLFSCTLDFSEHVSIDSSEPSRITSSGESKEEALDNFYEDSYNFLSRLNLLSIMKNDSNSEFESDSSNEDFYNFDQKTRSDSKPSNNPLTENEILALRNSARSKMDAVQAEMTKLLAQLGALENEVVDDFDVFVQNLKIDELKNDIEKRENMLETIEHEFSKYQNILNAIGYKEISDENVGLTNMRDEANLSDNPTTTLKNISEIEVPKSDSKRIKTTYQYIKNDSDSENEISDRTGEHVEFEDSTLHDDHLNLTDLKRKYGY